MGVYRVPRTEILKIKRYIFFLQPSKGGPPIFESFTFGGQLTASWASDEYVHLHKSCSPWSEDSKKVWHISVGLLGLEIWLFLSIQADFQLSTIEIGIIWKIGLKSKFKTFKWNSLVCIMSKSLPCFFAPHSFEL